MPLSTERDWESGRGIFDQGNMSPGFDGRRETPLKSLVSTDPSFEIKSQGTFFLDRLEDKSNETLFVFESS